MSEQVEDFLEHHGVKGMKWGRRTGGASSGSSGGGKSTAGAERKAVRKEMYKESGATLKRNKGKTAVGLFLAGPSATAGIAMARGAGHGKGASVAIGLIGGAPGGMLAVHLAARKITKEDN
jgi:hypothetical protein